MESTALITGASGFVGAHLARRLLEHGHKVVCLFYDYRPVTTLTLLGLSERVTMVQGDICNTDLMRQILAKYYVQDVYHLAAQAIVGVALRDPCSTYRISCMGATSILEACRDVGVRGILCTSTDKVYGEGLNKAESDSFEARGIYETSKVCMDFISRSFFHTYKLPVAVSRSCNVYGECDLNRRIVPNTIRALKEDRAPVIFKNDESLREYVYVHDVCEAYMTLMANIDQSKGEAYNVGTAEVIGQEDLVKKMIRISGKPIAPVYVDKPPSSFEIYRQSVNSDKIRRQFGWKPDFSLDQGLLETWNRWK
ncbi:MAG: GDP-mannose 4,6-dehydratase [Chloroflexi bacterium]|nr:GDP-mannose 4,6-dehydratase [Chloroflexota bacterium]